ncbi:uncharacterized protein LOC134817218 [Bolinopsis microptera]|uniref:uncharacterized protein LOC134817218 n=1 Tax=Bolinopsis microptera TaxID=2820187 RepID=UPI00307923D6
MRLKEEELLDLHDDHLKERPSLTTPWLPRTNFVSPTTNTPWFPDYYHEEEETPDKFAQISTMIIFVVGMIVLGIVVYQFVLKKCKDDDMPPQRAGAPPALQSLITAATRTISITHYEECNGDEDTPLGISTDNKLLRGTLSEDEDGVPDPPTYQEVSYNKDRYHGQPQSNGQPQCEGIRSYPDHRSILDSRPLFIDVEPATP